MTEEQSPSNVHSSLSPRPSWYTRHAETVELDYYGRQVFRFHRRFPWQPFEALDALLAVSVAVAVVASSETLRFEVDHIELYLRPDDAYRLGDELLSTTDWPAWASKAEVVDGEPADDADLTVILVGADDVADGISEADRAKMGRSLLEFVERHKS